MKSISYPEFKLMMDGILYSIQRMAPALNDGAEFPIEDALALAVTFGDEFLDTQGIEIINEEEEDDDDIYDDVDETNYNPYMGCDDYDELGGGFFEEF